jgi:hypothetical protein
MMKSRGTRVAVFAGVTMAMPTLVLASPAGAADPNRCESVNGVVKYAFGSAICESTPSTGSKPNVAKATGGEAHARANGGNGDRATANGEKSDAEASLGDNNKATANGFQADASATDGDHIDVMAIGDNTTAQALNGNNNTAKAKGARSTAFAAFGDNDTATSSGGGHADADGGNATANATGNCSITETLPGVTASCLT